jgi:branched-subunit amino acid aminotransferase/4-amino-4-deoxychorismate lyase
MGRREVREARMGMSDLGTADEIFLTSSWLGVMPASSLEWRELPSREIATQLRVEYAREIG